MQSPKDYFALTLNITALQDLYLLPGEQKHNCFFSCLSSGSQINYQKCESDYSFHVSQPRMGVLQIFLFLVFLHFKDISVCLYAEIKFPHHTLNSLMVETLNSVPPETGMVLHREQFFFFFFDVCVCVCVCVLAVQSCPTLLDLMDCSLLGSSVHVILQAGIWEWVRKWQPRD